MIDIYGVLVYNLIEKITVFSVDLWPLFAYNIYDILLWMEVIMKRGYKDMCKYANNNVVKVSTVEQVNIIRRVLESKSKTPNVSVPKTDFNKNLWVKNGTDNSIIKK